MTEATKTRTLIGDKLKPWLNGAGIDIGCGDDPILPTADRFDQEHGDANRIGDFINKKYDFVFSAHCLEHMQNPRQALRGWYEIVAPGGYLIVIVPDEDLYEQGHFPSIFNHDHKWTFTISKAKSWSPNSLNVIELARELPGAKLIEIELQDHGYDRALHRHKASGRARWLLKMFRSFNKRIKFKNSEKHLAKIFYGLGAVIDQTGMSDFRLAQIMLVVQKT